jgi:hypothetical protein
MPKKAEERLAGTGVLKEIPKVYWLLASRPMLKNMQPDSNMKNEFRSNII